MKKTVRILVLVVALAVALSVTAFAIEASREENYKWSNYSGTCTLSANPSEVHASMSVTVDSLGMITPGAEFKMEGTAYFLNPKGTGKLVDQPLDTSRNLPSSIGDSDYIGRTATNGDYLSVMANCTYSIPMVNRDMTLHV